MKLLSIKNLHTKVNDKEILKGLDLEINKGEIHVIMGPNGGGKSTLANTIFASSKYIVTDGTITFNESLLSVTVKPNLSNIDITY